MDTTLITIHDLSDEARILYSSDSIVDILGHTPDEVVNKSCWEFFHPDEVPVARDFHSRGVNLDKAAVLAYCQIRNREGNWVGCECCFSVVYDVMVVCTSIYHRGPTSQKRAVEAPIVRRLFSSSPKDPRYHMLSHLSSKFDLGPKQQTHEPRAALFLNRFTRTLTIMYATAGIEQIIGISGESMKGRSFYYCIAENCLEDAVKCLETAKGNDSIAYLRFWFRDPRQDDAPGDPTSTEDDDTEDEEMIDITTSEDDEEGGVALQRRSQSNSTTGTGSGATSSHEMDLDQSLHLGEQSRTSSGDSSTLAARDTHAAIFGRTARAHDSTSSLGSLSTQHDDPIELEAVVSCTSDGLVVCLRRARPIVPTQQPPPAQYAYTNGLFAAPWAPEPIVPQLPRPPQQVNPYGAAYITQPRPGVAQAVAQANNPGGPNMTDFMNSIRDVAVFAWALTGINGSLTDYSRGKPKGESQPPDGFPIWTPNKSGNDNNNSSGGTSSTGSGHGSVDGGRSNSALGLCSPTGGFNNRSPGSRDPFGDPGLSSNNGSTSSGSNTRYS